MLVLPQDKRQVDLVGLDGDGHWTGRAAGESAITFVRGRDDVRADAQSTGRKRRHAS